jgi:peptidoglycan/xylan/chitin deacetylase (PgdA/CDA1 family)
MLNEMSELTIVMYHYVRDLERSRYPGVKGRRVSEFRSQLDYIGRHYTVVAAEDVIAAAKGRARLPDKAAWLTFDDGYLDHFLTVFPLLHARGWQGSFFPPARAILERELLDVNKIQFVLVCQQDPAPILQEMRVFVNDRMGSDGLLGFDEYWKQLPKASRFDSAEVTFVKHMLQHALPEAMRTELSDQLFSRFVCVDPVAFASELYMNADQLRTMVRCGMYVGSHGDGHYWLDHLTPERQAVEIDRSKAFLRSIGAPDEDWVMCYPYGAHNDSLIDLLRQQRCVVALTTRVGVARIETDDLLTLPRLDTNDLPYR